jgi:hypothetical protein
MMIQAQFQARTANIWSISFLFISILRSLSFFKHCFDVSQIKVLVRDFLLSTNYGGPRLICDPRPTTGSRSTNNPRFSDPRLL